MSDIVELGKLALEFAHICKEAKEISELPPNSFERQRKTNATVLHFMAQNRTQQQQMAQSWRGQLSPRNPIVPTIQNFPFLKRPG